MELDNLYIHPRWRQGFEAQSRGDLPMPAPHPAPRKRRTAAPASVAYPTPLLLLAFFATIGVIATCGAVVFGVYLLASSQLVAEAIQNYDVSDALFTAAIVVILCAWCLREATRS